MSDKNDSSQNTLVEIKKGKCIEYLAGKSSKIIIDGQCPSLNTKNPPTFLIGFTGTGMVGTILINELIDQLDMMSIGYVLSEDLPPITLFYDGILKHPFRLHYSEKYNLLVSICEVPFLPGSYMDLARTLMAWALNSGLQDIICIQGMADDNLFREPPYPVYVAGEKDVVLKLKSYKIDTPPKGLIMGAEAAILNECMNNKLNGSIFLTPANPQVPCPEGAAAILEKLSKIYNFPIKTEKLLAQAQAIKQDLLEITNKTNEMHSQDMSDRGSKFRDRMIYS